MTPRRPHLRNRKRIKAPTRYEDEFNTPSPRQEPREESEPSSNLEEEIYRPPKPKRPKTNPRAYHGEVTQFNPNLPPAAFPTLDHPDYVRNGGTIAVALDLDSHVSGLRSGESSSEASDSDDSSRGFYHEGIGLLGRLPTVTRTSNMVREGARGGMPSSVYGEVTDNGPRNPIWVSNMARMEAAGMMSDLDRTMLEMETSGEEDEDFLSGEGDAAVRSTKLARTASVPQVPAWDDLTVAHKLDLTDAIAELFPDPAEYMDQLRLRLPQRNELGELLDQRHDQAAREKANQQRLQEQTKDILLQGRPLSQSTFHEMVEENLYGTINENDPIQTNLKELKKARAYLKHCGLDPALADGSWDVPSISNAAKGRRPRTAQGHPKASRSTLAAPKPSMPSEGPFSTRPAMSSPSNQAPCPPDASLELMQQHTPRALPQYRPTVTQALIAQHSPAAPLSKVPMQSYRVAPSNQSGDIRARYQSFARAQQPTLPALPDPFAGPDQRAINRAFSRAHGPSTSLPHWPEDQSLHVVSPSLVPTGLPTARKKRASQSSEVLNVEVPAPQKHGQVVDHGDPVNKKKRKKAAI